MDAPLGLPGFLDMCDLRRRETEQGEAVPRGLDQLWVARAARNQQLLLGRQQIRREDPGETVPAAHRIPNRTQAEFFDPTRLTPFDRLDPALIGGHHAASIYGWGEAASRHS